MTNGLYILEYAKGLWFVTYLNDEVVSYVCMYDAAGTLRNNAFVSPGDRTISIKQFVNEHPATRLVRFEEWANLK